MTAILLKDFDRWPSGITQADVPANNNAQRLDVLTRAVISTTVTAQPGSPTSGDLYILPVGKTGAIWATFADGALAYFKSGTWYEYTPYEGLPKYSSATNTVWLYDGSWVEQVNIKPHSFQVMLGDMTTDITTGANKAFWIAPYALTGMSFIVDVFDPSSSGNPTFDINKNGATILSTKLSIDATETTSRTATTPYVATSTVASAGDIFTFDIDAAGADCKGPLITIIGTP